MLANRPPFAASTLAELLRMQLHQIPPDIREYCPDIDTDLDELIQQSLAKDVGERISDWEQIRKILSLEIVPNLIPLEADEMGVSIRLHYDSHHQSEKIMQAIEKVLEDEAVIFSIETQRADGDS